MRFRPLASLPASVALLMACATGSAAPSATQAPTTARVAAGREQLPDQQVLQVLNRLGYGPRPGDVARVRAMGVDRWIALQLTPNKINDRIADRALEHYQHLDASTADIVQASRAAQQARRAAQRRGPGGDTAMRAPAGDRRRRGNPDTRALQQRALAPVRELESATLARAVLSDRQLYEQMVNFWENHFSVFVGKGQTRNYLPAYDRDVIRPHTLGKFRDLLGAVAHSPAMLFYLDNWESQADSMHSTLTANGRVGSPTRRRQARKRGLNENYGRELMELHTLGVDGGYTQQDVIEVARCLTGWSIDPRTGAFVFRPQWHDADAKVVLGHHIPAGREEEDGEQVLDILASSPATARFIARKLVVHFVSDSPPPALVARAAQTFLKTDGDIREVLRTIVTSPEFFSNSAYRAKVKAPFEVVASGLRALNAQPDTTARLVGLVARLGQPEFGRPTPDGWPDRADAWMNTGAILNRINFGLLLASGRLPGAPFSNWPYADSLGHAPHAQQVEGVITHILGGEVSQVTRGVLMAGRNPLLDQAQDDSLAGMANTADTGAMSSRRDAGTPRRGRRAGILTHAVSFTGLPLVVGLALGAPEFQRR